MRLGATGRRHRLALLAAAVLAAAIGTAAAVVLGARTSGDVAAPPSPRAPDPRTLPGEDDPRPPPSAGPIVGGGASPPAASPGPIVEGGAEPPAPSPGPIVAGGELPPSPPSGGVDPGGGADAVFAKIDSILTRLPPADIAFNAPRRLRLGETAAIQLVLSGGRSIEALKGEITEAGDRQGAEVRVSPQMDARLTGLGFKIQATTPERQPVSLSGQTITEWGWEIQPTESGTRRLTLTLSAVIDVDGAEATPTIETFRHVLEIRVGWADRVTAFGSRNWQWLWAAVLVPIGGWLLRRRGAAKDDRPVTSARTPQRGGGSRRRGARSRGTGRNSRKPGRA